MLGDRHVGGVVGTEVVARTPHRRQEPAFGSHMVDLGSEVLFRHRLGLRGGQETRSFVPPDGAQSLDRGVGRRCPSEILREHPPRDITHRAVVDQAADLALQPDDDRRHRPLTGDIGRDDHVTVPGQIGRRGRG